MGGDAAPPDEGLPAGTVLDGYRIEAPLGEGGMGRVYRARRDGGDPVALKVLHPWLVMDSELHARFLREARVGRRVVHANVVRTLEAGSAEHGGESLEYLAMELVEGRTLTTLLDEYERVPEELCRHIAREVASGLAAIHAHGVVHRDLKPPNVLLTPDHAIKIMDLGIALVADASMRLSRTGRFIGTVLYAAPEQLDPQSREVDGRADLYSLGMVLYELATGRHPFKGLSLREALLKQVQETPPRAGEVNPQLTPFFEEILARLLSKDPDARFATAVELHAALAGGETSGWWGTRVEQIHAHGDRPLRRMRLQRDSALVGRAAELDRLDALWRDAAAGDGRVLLLEGEAGIGKSRLIDEFVARLSERGERPRFLLGAWPPGGAADGPGAFAQALREHFGDARLARALPRWLGDAAALAPSLAARLRGDAPPAGGPPLGDTPLRDAVVQVVGALAADGPTLLVAEDLHFAPPEGRELFRAVAQAACGRPLLLVGTARPEGEARDVAPGAEHLVLGRLQPDDVVRLLEEVLGSRRLAEELASDAGERSGGNPFFLFELLRGLREQGQLERRDDGTWSRVTVSRRVAPPSSVRELIRQRLAVLDEEDRALLEVAACCGTEFDADVPAAVLGESRLAVLERLARLENDHRLVRSVGAGFRFDHDEVRRTLVDELAEALAAEYHAAIADVLEERAGPDGPEGEEACTLTSHLQEAGLHGRAARHLGRALEHLDRTWRHEAALVMAGRALEAGEGIDADLRREVLARQVRRLQLLDRLDPMRAAVDEALAAAEGHPRTRARILGTFASALCAHGAFEEAEGRARDALREAREADDPLAERMAWRAAGLSLAQRGRFDDARDAFTRQLEVARRAEDPEAEADALSRLGDAWARAGDYDRAIACHEQALERAAASGSDAMRAMLGGRLGTVYHSLGRYRDCLELYEGAVRYARETANRTAECQWLGNHGTAHMNLGEYDRALDDFGHALARARETGNAATIAWIEACLGEASLRLGRYDDARAAWETTLRFERDSGDLRNAAYSLLGLGEIALADGDFAGARAKLEEARATWESIGYPSGLAEAAVALGRLAFTEGDRAAARARFLEARDRSRELARPGCELVATAYACLLAGGADDGAAAARMEELDPASEHHRRAEAWFVLHKATRERAPLDRAVALVEEAAAPLADDPRATFLRDVPVNREILRAAGRGDGA